MTRLAGPLAAAVLLAITLATYGRRVPSAPFPVPVFPVATVVFITAGSVVVAYVAWRAYLASGVTSTLFVGSGSLVFGLTALAASLMAGRGGSNPATTAFILGALAASGLHGACAVSRHFPPGRSRGSQAAAVSTAVLSLAIVALVLESSVAGNLPAFFVGVTGMTLTGKVVLGVALAVYAAVALAMGTAGRPAVLYWYSWALGITAVGLLGLLASAWVFLDLVFWAGRIALCVGGVFLVMSVQATEGEDETGGPGV